MLTVNAAVMPPERKISPAGLLSQAGESPLGYPRRPVSADKIFLCLVALILSACGCRQDAFTLRGEALGTFYTITVAAPPACMSEERTRELTDATLDRVNTRMSTYRDDSELSRFNQYDGQAPFHLSQESYKVFEIARTISEQSGGAFDVTVGPLVNAWGFGPAALTNPPDDAKVKELLERTGYEKLTLLPENTLTKSRPDVYCDLSAIAKGYAVDAVAEAFEKAGIHRYMIEVGGEIRVAGKNKHDLPWTLGIEAPKPEVRELYAAVHLEQGALATSGDYRNMYEYEGRIVSHTIDPHTGYPVHHTLASASVIHPSCTWADGYATALMALGPEKAKEFALKHELAVMLLIHNPGSGGFTEFSTPQFDACRTEMPKQ